MPSPYQHGLTTLTWGTPTQTGFVVQAFSKSSKCNVEFAVQDETGRVVHRRYDDDTTEMTFDAYMLTTATLPEPGTVMTVDSVKYIVQTVDVKRAVADALQVSIKGITSEGITLA